MTNSTVRQCIYAGQFYPSAKEELSSQIHGFLDKVKHEKLKGKLCGLIVPHAWYIYSGQTAAFGYYALKEASPKRIILAGPSHQTGFEGAFGFNGFWETPLGLISIKKSHLESIENDAEHSLEVQLPFLQSTLKSFEFVPIVYSEINPRKLSRILDKEHDHQSVIIISSDLSHYLPHSQAKKIDLTTIEAIKKLDLDEFLKVGDACGKTGIAALMMLAQQYKWKPFLLDYRNSGDTAGDKDSVVGYCAIAFVE